MKRVVTLSEPSRVDSAHADEHTPLLAPTDSSFQCASPVESFFKYGKNLSKGAWAFLSSDVGQNILKCSIAYLLGSMATFLAPLAAFLGKQDGKHLVATITVYFHPARSRGSMYEAVLLAGLAFLYIAFISLTSMSISVAFADHGLKPLGHAVVLVVFCGGGLGLIGWLKQRLQNALVNVACSLASLAIITVLTKEGAVQMATYSGAKVVQVLKMVIIGSFFTTFVCLTVKPTSADTKLRYEACLLKYALSDPDLENL